MKPSEGSRLKAFVVAAPTFDTSTLTIALESLANAHLAAVERPRSYAFGASLPTDEKGKPADWPLMGGGDC